MGRFIHTFFFLLLLITLKGQDIELANQYLQKEEYEKARTQYEIALKKRVPLIEVYPSYLKTLLKLDEKAEADKFFRKLLRDENTPQTVKLDYIIFLKNTNSKEYEKILNKYEKEALEEENTFTKSLTYLISQGEFVVAEHFILYYRKATSRKTAYYQEMADIKKAQDKKREMSEELLLGLLNEEDDSDNLKNILQNYLTEPDAIEYFKTLLLNESQKDPQNTSLSELLLWIFIQQRDFNSAAIHAKAIDKRARNLGEKQKEVAELAMDNKNFDAAISIYSALIKDYPRSSVATFAKGRYLQAREMKIKSKFPVNKAELESLVTDYRNLINEATQTGSTNGYKYRADMALLYGFYLDKLDSAIILINKSLHESQFDKKFQAQARLHLADLYLLDNQPWESTLLYSQVESLEKDQLLGHEAKLKNARLYYYQGDFILAQEQMDVLKLATSREISNDAIQLSVLIQDNLTEDTTGYALKKYAEIELLIFQNKWDEAKVELDSLYKEYRAETLKDDILMLQGRIARQFGEYEKAIQKFDLLLQNHSEDILADDAAFQIAQLYDFELKNSSKAMEYYNRIITSFPSSIYVVESRKRFRMLRGDKVN